MKATADNATYQQLADQLEQAGLFADKSWRVSPQSWPLTAAQLKELTRIGEACAEFYAAMETLYRRSSEGKNLLRNGELYAPWVADYLNRGKPERLVRHSLHEVNKGALPSVLRPDLLQTDDGWALTELDSVPGGIGLTSFLNQLYADRGERILGADDRMPDLFYSALAALVPEVRAPLIAIVVSDEGATYLPEFEWLAEQLRKRGRRVYCFHPDSVMPLGRAICVPIDGNPEKVDVLYRFFELFDLQNVSTANAILDAVEDGEVIVSPPMRPFQEEKMNLALFHHGLLQDFWRDHLSRAARRMLSKLIPRSWVMERADLPPSAVLDAPYVGGKPIRQWEELGAASQRERNLIIKASGFHETAWGARSVILGSDSSREVWKAGLAEALDASATTPHVLQEYHKPCRLQHPVYSDDGVLRQEDGRLRLCPFYFVEGQTVTMGGALATFCPADKKIIHGMRDAALLPCHETDGDDSTR